MKMVRKLPSSPSRASTEADAGEYVNASNNHSVTFSVYDVADLFVDNVTSGSRSQPGKFDSIVYIKKTVLSLR